MSTVLRNNRLLTITDGVNYQKTTKSADNMDIFISYFYFKFTI